MAITEAASGFPNASGTIPPENGMVSEIISERGWNISIAGEGLCVGRDSGEAVTDDYPGTSPWRFTGGTIRQVQVNVSGKPYVDLEHEAVAMMSRE